MAQNPNFFGEVYVHTCIPNGKSYVGQTTVGVSRRWCDQVKITRWPKHVGHNYPLSRAIRKCGKNAFEHQVLAVAHSKAELDNLEKVWIISLQTRKPNGYNITAGGEGNFGLTHTEATKAKISQNRQGKGLGNTNALGTIRSAENKIQDSLRLKGKKFSAEHNEKIRQARTGVPRPDVTAWNNRRWAAIRAAKAATHGA